MAINIVGASLSSAQYGVETDESGLNLESWEVRYFLEVNEKLANIRGQTRGRARADKISRDITFSGEVTGALTLFVFSAAITAFTNDVADIGGTASGGIYLDEGTITQNRTGWRSLAGKASSDPECA